MLIHEVVEAQKRETNAGLQFLTVRRGEDVFEVIGAPGVYEVGDLVLVAKKLTASDTFIRRAKFPPGSNDAHHTAIKLKDFFGRSTHAPGEINALDMTLESDFDFSVFFQ